MNNIFVDDIKHHGDKQLNPPSPDRYRVADTFGKVGLKYSMGANVYRSGLKNDNMHDYYRDRERKLPGPGSYHHSDVVGKS